MGVRLVREVETVEGVVDSEVTESCHSNVFGGFTRKTVMRDHRRVERALS